MTLMRAMQVSEAGGRFELVEKEIPHPAAGEVRIKVNACGICHSDLFVKEGLFPGIDYPRVPGHEVAGVIDALGAGVNGWEVGQPVGVGWHGGHCFYCEPCRQGDFVNCRNGKITGISFDGGYAEYMTAPAEALALIPPELEATQAAPLLCAGITTYNALRHSGARPGDTVAIQGIGGLGHLAVQFAHRMGFRTVAVSGGGRKLELARQLGADYYIDARASDPVAELQKMGGAKVILATAPSSEVISRIFSGLAENGSLIVVGVGTEPIQVSPMQLIAGRHSLCGWPSGTGMDSEETLKFCALTDVSPLIETYPLEEANEAYHRMLSNKARFRAVLQISV